MVDPHKCTLMNAYNLRDKVIGTKVERRWRIVYSIMGCNEGVLLPRMLRKQMQAAACTRSRLEISEDLNKQKTHWSSLKG